MHDVPELKLYAVDEWKESLGFEFYYKTSTESMLHSMSSNTQMHLTGPKQKMETDIWIVFSSKV